MHALAFNPGRPFAPP